MTKANSPPVVLLDANVLIALATREHLSHAKAHEWLSTTGFGVATCPITQGALVRFHARLAEANGAQRAKAILVALESNSRHHFWPDDLPYTAVPDRGLRGHKQVTDMYLAALAESRGSRLVTLDQALKAWRPEACLLIV